GNSGLPARARMWLYSLFAHKSSNNCWTDMAANREKKVSIGRRPAREKSLASRAAAARSACFVKCFPR
ncbi:hypothetical protein D0817_25980, partial [Flavobacterium cupreum]